MTNKIIVANYDYFDSSNRVIDCDGIDLENPKTMCIPITASFEFLVNVFSDCVIRELEDFDCENLNLNLPD